MRKLCTLAVAASLLFGCGGAGVVCEDPTKHLPCVGDLQGRWRLHATCGQPLISSECAGTTSTDSVSRDELLIIGNPTVIWTESDHGTLAVDFDPSCANLSAAQCSSLSGVVDDGITRTCTTADTRCSCTDTVDVESNRTAKAAFSASPGRPRSRSTTSSA